MWYISHVFLNMYERSPNESKYTGTMTTNATKALLLESIPRDNRGPLTKTMGNTRSQNMSFGPRGDGCWRHDEHVCAV